MRACVCICVCVCVFVCGVINANIYFWTLRFRRNSLSSPHIARCVSMYYFT